MAYCTIAQATAAGATGTNDEITEAIAIAQELVNTFTGDLFEETPDTTVVASYANGLILLPYRLAASPTPTVRLVGADTDVEATSYRLRTGSSVGDIDAIEWIGGGSGSYSHPNRFTITGTFGWETTPKAVARATALIAASLTKYPTGNPTAGVKAISVEGYSRQYGDNGTATTGVPEADLLLSPYRMVILA